MTALLPISAVVPTRNRYCALERMLHSLAQQSCQPIEVILVDASSTTESEDLLKYGIQGLSSQLLYYRAIQVGAAKQRNQAVSYASQPNILFIDDDIVFEEHCLLRLWEALDNDNSVGAVSAMILNQRYSSPGLLSRSLFRVLNGHAESSYAGRCIGPALNLLPEDSDNLPEQVPVEWLNTTCTLYRRQALPDPPFLDHFEGYSFMEDVALSLTVGKKWKLANARTARIYHDSQPAEYKSNQFVMAKMALVNRHFIMTEILGRRRLSDYLKLILLEAFGVATSLTSSKAWQSLPSVLLGKTSGATQIAFKWRSTVSHHKVRNTEDEVISGQ